MNTFHLSGYPRIGAKRELKFAVEAFWKGAKSEAELQAVAAEIRRLNWAAQKRPVPICCRWAIFRFTTKCSTRKWRWAVFPSALVLMRPI